MNLIKSWFCSPLVHPCDKPTNGGCDTTCIKDGEKAKCGCDAGYKLLEDGTTCEKSKWFSHNLFPSN